MAVYVTRSEFVCVVLALLPVYPSVGLRGVRFWVCVPPFAVVVEHLIYSILSLVRPRR